MRIGVLSDCVLPTPYSTGHGLGRVVSNVSEGLLARGHDVTLFAKAGSRFRGSLVTPPDAEGYEGETLLAKAAYTEHRHCPFDVLLDNSHQHHLAGLFPRLPVVNVFHDIYQEPARCPVLLSTGQRALMGTAFDDARIIANAVYNAEQIEPSYTPFEKPYALWMGSLSEIKQPLLAIEACARLDVPLVIAGKPLLGRMPWGQYENVHYHGEVGGEEKLNLLRNARVFLQLGTSESFGLTTLEAGLVGTPTVAWPAGGNLDVIQYGMNGVLIPTSGSDKLSALVDTMERAWYMNRQVVHEYTVTINRPERQLDAYEAALGACYMGAWW